ncbi:DMT family transporter [Tepidibacter hydrothermalis]|uniref:DMT family transporter n=1 Tax=Tepidibacter hydrothermalis TaxID=3036126 RepID=A0ABY8EBP9_9FIRM|nr:DMT family transporter [Tepidibacter hydrothermalis]WFD08937.1 DMT family transporter [Tepidibacter hydrothermalis]
MDKNKLMAILGAITCAVLWGVSFLSIKVTVIAIPPISLAIFRFSIAILTLFFFRIIKKDFSKIEKQDISKIILAGILGISLYYYFQNTGIKLIPASQASIILGAIPVFSLLAESLVYRTKLTRQKTGYISLSFIGVFILTGINQNSSSSSYLGYFMMFATVISWILYCIVIKPLFEKYSQITILYYQSIFGVLFLIPFSLFEKIDFKNFDISIIMHLLFLGVLCSALAYTLYIFSMSNLGVSNASIYLNLIPVVGVLASATILHEIITLNQIIGGILVLFSVYMINKEGSKPLEADNLLVENVPKNLSEELAFRHK